MGVMFDHPASLERRPSTTGERRTSSVGRIVLNRAIDDETYATQLSTGVLSHVAGKRVAEAVASVTIDRATLTAVLLGLLDAPDPDFAIVTP